MRLVGLALLIVSALLLASCGSEEDKAPLPRTSSMGERINLGHIVYVVYETQWLTHLGDGADAHIPQNRYFLIRMSAVNGSPGEIMVPNVSIEDDLGKVYPEMSGDETRMVPQYIGYLRKIRPAESVQGWLLFDAPPTHYKLKIADENNDRIGYVDIPLSFSNESPEVPAVGGAVTAPLPEAPLPKSLPTPPKKK